MWFRLNVFFFPFPHIPYVFILSGVPSLPPFLISQLMFLSLSLSLSTHPFLLANEERPFQSVGLSK